MHALYPVYPFKPPGRPAGDGEDGPRPPEVGHLEEAVAQAVEVPPPQGVEDLYLVVDEKDEPRVAGEEAAVALRVPGGGHHEVHRLGERLQVPVRVDGDPRRLQGPAHREGALGLGEGGLGGEPQGLHPGKHLPEIDLASPDAPGVGEEEDPHRCSRARRTARAWTSRGT